MTSQGLLGLAVLSLGIAAAPAREAPDPASGQFAHIFTEGAEVVVRLPADLRGKAVRWAAADERGTAGPQGEFAPGAETASLGAVGLGWYRIGFLDAAGNEVGWTTAAVLARAPLPVRDDSPVCTDAATAWFAHSDPVRQERFAILAALARTNWVRDRMTWGEAEPRPGELAEKTSYDTSASLQAERGLRVLQVFHGTPAWAGDKALDGDAPGRRFPRDLRALHRFCRLMAERYRGRVLAWEPWNEANIDGFGGHTADEMCTLQKAAFLGFKAGDPGLTVCWNVFAGSPNGLQADLILGNEADAYMDTFNVHSYSPVDSYAAEMTHARVVAAGKPIWLTECGIHVHSQQPRPWGDLSPEESRRQAWFVPASFASSLFSGVERHFFFILGNYMEGDVQFGLLRHDMTPRPAYCALAAVGRFLDGARCLGRVPAASNADRRRVYAFRAFPDGAERDVLIAWAASDEAVPGPAVSGAQVYDALGRPAPAERLASLSREPVFAVLPPGQAEALGLEKPLAVAGPRRTVPSPLVVQAEFPESTKDLGAQSHRVRAGETLAVPVHVYNFGSEARSATVRVSGLPEGWAAEPASWEVEVPVGERVTNTLRVAVPASGQGLVRGVTVTLRAEGEGTAAVLQFRLTADLAKAVPVERRPLASALRPEAWEDNIVGGSTLTHRAEEGGMRFDMRFGQADPWSYPRLTLAPGDLPDSRVQGLRFTLQVHEGKGTFRVQFVEENGSCYIADTGSDASLRTPQTVTVLLNAARWGEWSPRDTADGLQTEAIRRLMVGVNSERGSTLSFSVRDLEWVRLEP